MAWSLLCAFRKLDTKKNRLSMQRSQIVADTWCVMASPQAQPTQTRRVPPIRMLEAPRCHQALAEHDEHSTIVPPAGT